jgi:hypothetical protein
MNILDNAILAKGLASNGTVKEICKVSDIIGKTGRIDVTVSNFKNVEKGLKFLLTTDKGEVVSFLASKAVSADFRAKTLKMSDVAHLPLVEYKTKGPEDTALTPINDRTGEVIAMITYPSDSGQVIGIEAKEVSKEFTRPALDETSIRNMIAF